jgi:hypothetical protein
MSRVDLSMIGFQQRPGIHQPFNPKKEPPKEKIPMTMEEADIIVDLNYIIENKPKAKVVREFLRENLASIKSEDDLLFE